MNTRRTSPSKAKLTLKIKKKESYSRTQLGNDNKSLTSHEEDKHIVELCEIKKQSIKDNKEYRTEQISLEKKKYELNKDIEQKKTRNGIKETSIT